jgi:hypothetical protein
MICSKCRTGGAWNQAWRETQLDRMMKIAISFHKECVGDCGCQHTVGVDSLNAFK